MSDPVTTIVPFSALPSCATKCGPLYDANGACVPPAAPQGDENTYRSCFCSYSKLQPFKTTTAGVCDAGCDAAGLSGVQEWFTGFCDGKAASSATSGSSKGGSSGSAQGSGGGWLSTHWQWVIFIVVVVVGIAGIWTGACIWRRKYLRKKDRMYELGKGLPSSVAVNAQGDLTGPGAAARNQPGVFMPGAAAAGLNEKPRKAGKKWNGTQRT